MLVLSRKCGESVVIAGEIVVNVVAIGRNRVQIGIQAPPHLTVHREEIHQRIVAGSERSFGEPIAALVPTALSKTLSVETVH